MSHGHPADGAARIAEHLFVTGLLAAPRLSGEHGHWQ